MQYYNKITLYTTFIPNRHERKDDRDTIDESISRDDNDTIDVGDTTRHEVSKESDGETKGKRRRRLVRRGGRGFRREPCRKSCFISTGYLS